MSNTETRTIVGIPFYDGEGIEVLEACLANVDECLNYLNIDAKVVIGINGPRSSLGKALSYEIDRSKYNADLKFIKTPQGQVEAVKEICVLAKAEDYKRIFITDADISRLPLSIYNMWTNGSKRLVGANYATYPVEILLESGVQIINEEIALIKIFEADKHPLAREFTHEYRPVKRLKSSLILVDTQITSSMFGSQSVAVDSRMNSLIPVEDRQFVENAAFMHYARIDLADHIQARLRHYRAAALEGDLNSFAEKSLIYKPDVAEKIAGKIVQKYPRASDVASNFLLECALRFHVNNICCKIVRGEKPEIKSDKTYEGKDLLSEVNSFKEAYDKIAYLLRKVDWNFINSPITFGDGTTQNNQPRIPINLEPFLDSDYFRKIILNQLGLSVDTEV